MEKKRTIKQILIVNKVVRVPAWKQDKGIDFDYWNYFLSSRKQDVGFLLQTIEPIKITNKETIFINFHKCAERNKV